LSPSWGIPFRTQKYDGIDGSLIYHPEELSEKAMVEDGEAFEVTRLLAQKEGLFVGTSAGAAVAVASGRRERWRGHNRCDTA